MNRTDIQWTHWSANALKLELPDGSRVNACVKISPGCKACYAESIVRRFWRKAWGKFPGYSAALLKVGKPVLVEEELQAVLRLSYRIADGKADPAINKIFWHDMTDEYLSFWPDEMLEQIWAVRALTRNLIHQVLTKRPQRMASFLNWTTGKGLDRKDMIVGACMAMAANFPLRESSWRGEVEMGNESRVWPLPNVWAGTSVENQKAADRRIPELLTCPAAVRFISAEPLFGPIDLLRVRVGKALAPHNPEHRIDCLRLGYWSKEWGYTSHSDLSKTCGGHGIDWGIVGCESNGSRVGRFADGYEAAARSILKQLSDFGSPVFHKQTPVAGRVSGNPMEWPEDLRVRQFPAAQPEAAKQ